MSAEDLGPAALSITNFCSWASISRAQVYREVRAGRLVMRKVGKKSIITAHEAKSWLDSLPASPANSSVQLD